MNKVYQIVADKIIAQLEAADSDWQKPWFNLKTAPKNIRGNVYRGINTFLLSGIERPLFATFKQWKEKDCKIIKGESGHLVVFWKFLDKKDSDGTIVDGKIPMLRYYKVWSLDQVTGEYADKLRTDLETSLVEHDSHEAAETVIADYIARESIMTGNGDRACYIPSLDTIQMPLKGQFQTKEHYYSTFFHEMAHSTGHKSRLDRDLKNGFGTVGYAFEELVAEFAAAMTSAALGVESAPRADHVQYIKHWITGLKETPQAAIQAASRAQKATDYMLANQPVTES